MSRMSTAEHSALDWRIDELVSDFELLDVWRLPATGASDDFQDLVTAWSQVTNPETPPKSRSTRVVLGVRTRLGEWFGWDDNLNELPIPGCAEISLRDRLSDDLKAPPGDLKEVGFFRPVFSTDREWVGELSNSTVHAAAQLGWVPREDGLFEGRLAVYAKTRGRLGSVYMKAIAPFRHYVVYPTMVRSIGDVWDSRALSNH